MSNLTILNSSIRSLDNLYSLNDLHFASGSDKNHQPAFFIRNAQTQELIAEIERSANSQIAVKTVRGGRNPALQGTWACEELALAYATWISPKFHLVVLRAFIAMHRGETMPQQLALPEPETKYAFELTEEELRQLIWLWFGHKQMNGLLGELEPALRAIGSNLHPMIYSHHREYRHQHQQTLELMRKFIAPFKAHSDIDWQRLERHLQSAHYEQVKSQVIARKRLRA